jgi:pSer/pThr/pTyr-binding forkhead associated (FHA) protein/tetratricopeptide (TPR) repeat protein
VFKLTIEDDEGKTTVVPLARDEMTIGRLEGNTIRLTERNISRRHARLSQQDGGLYIEDLASFTGVRVNGTKIGSPTPLREGDEVQIGDYRIVLRGEPRPVNDRPTMPNMPAVSTPMATVGGPVAIPTRASVAAMAAQALPQAAAPESPPRARIKTSPTLAVAAPVVSEAAPDAVEGQPTIPLRVIAAVVGAETSAAPAARMLVLTTDLAGSEFTLDRDSLVIGRTDENEVVLNHRSISRHHAKIVREGERYTIVDLQSANGVRVNGEDYERIELNPGDVVELGHVKLRFIGPLEEFTFDPAAPLGRRRLPVKVLAAAGGAVVSVALVALLLHHGTREGAPGASEAAGAPSSPSPSPSVAVAPAPSVAPPAPATPPPSTPAASLAEARQAVAVEDWDAAHAALDRIGPGALDPEVRREAAALGRRVDTERLGAALFAKFDAAANAKDYAEALAGYERIPADSVFKKRARPRFEEAHTLLVAQHLATAEKARAAGRCAEVRAEAQAVIRLDPNNLLVRDMARLCRARPEAGAVAAERPARAKASATLVTDQGDAPRFEPTRVEVARAETASAEPEEAESLMKQAREAWLRQQCGAAMDLSRRALRAKPGLTDAYQILAVCSCSLKDAEGAGRAYARLDDRNRSLVHAFCQKNGVAVGQ